MFGSWDIQEHPLLVASCQMETAPMASKSRKLNYEPTCGKGNRHSSHWINSGKREEREGRGILEDVLPCKSNALWKHHLHEGHKHVSNQEHMESWCMHVSPHYWPTTGILALFVVNPVKLLNCRQGSGHEPCLMFAQHYSCSVHMLYPLVILWRGCVIETFSQNWRTLIYDKRISWRRNESKSLPSSKTTQRTAILSDVPRPPSLFSCFFHATTKPNYEERLPQGEHTMPKHRCQYLDRRCMKKM